MNEDRFLRQQDVLNVSKLSRMGIVLIGAGSIGSVTGLFLVKMGAANLTVFDADYVGSHNVSNQMYRLCDVGVAKAEAFRDLIEFYSGESVEYSLQRYTNQPLAEVVISAVDSMESRKTIWMSVRDQPVVKLFLDARMGLETLVVYAIRPQVKEDRVVYSHSLVSDSEALQEPCTARSICYTPLMAASILCNAVKRYVNGEVIPRRIVLDLATYTLMV
jgi:hypothetical protein